MDIASRIDAAYLAARSAGIEVCIDGDETVTTGLVDLERLLAIEAAARELVKAAYDADAQFVYPIGRHPSEAVGVHEALGELRAALKTSCSNSSP